MAQCSLDFHVLSTLWMLEVGHLFDAKLTDRAYGNRLRRTQDGKGINKFSLGSFQPYLKPFRDWRDQGIEAMRTALAADKRSSHSRRCQLVLSRAEPRLHAKTSLRCRYAGAGVH